MSDDKIEITGLDVCQNIVTPALNFTRDIDLEVMDDRVKRIEDMVGKLVDDMDKKKIKEEIKRCSITVAERENSAILSRQYARAVRGEST